MRGAQELSREAEGLQKDARYQRRRRTPKTSSLGTKLSIPHHKRLHQLLDTMTEEEGRRVTIGEVFEQALDVLEREMTLADDQAIRIVTSKLPAKPTPVTRRSVGTKVRPEYHDRYFEVAEDSSRALDRYVPLYEVIEVALDLLIQSRKHTA